MTNTPKKFNLWVPLLLLFINMILSSFLIEELLIDASGPNYGSFILLAPLIALGSLLYIRGFRGKNSSFLIWILQGVNWIFLIFPVAAIVVFSLAFIQTTCCTSLNIRVAFNKHKCFFE